MSQRSFDYEKVDDLLKNAKSLKDIKGQGGVLQEMLKSTIERVMKAELEDQLGYPHNSRNEKNNRLSRAVLKKPEVGFRSFIYATLLSSSREKFLNIFKNSGICFIPTIFLILVFS